VPKGTIRKCKRCGYEWSQRLSGIPKRCANVECRTPYWNDDPRVPKEPIK
jgi:hypothetical protein